MPQIVVNENVSETTTFANSSEQSLIGYSDFSPAPGSSFDFYEEAEEDGLEDDSHGTTSRNEELVENATGSGLLGSGEGANDETALENPAFPKTDSTVQFDNLSGNDFDPAENEQSLVGSYNSGTNFDPDFDFDEAVQDDVLEDDEADLFTEDEVTFEVATENEPLGVEEATVEAVSSNDTNTSHSVFPVQLAKNNDQGLIVLPDPGHCETDDSSTTMLVDTLNVANAPPAEDESAFTYVSGDEGGNIVLGLNSEDLSLVEIRDQVTGKILSSRPIDGLHSIYIQGSDNGDDFLTIDFTSPFELADGIYYDGGDGYFDSLEVTGVAIGSYTPGDVFGDGVIVANNTTINFTGLEPVYIDGATISGSQNGLDAGGLPSSFTFTTPGGLDIITIDSPAAGENRISGSSGGVDFESITFKNVGTVIVDTGANDSADNQDDIITIDSSGLVATGLQNFSILTGDGDDRVVINSEGISLPVAGGGFSVTGSTVETDLNFENFVAQLRAAAGSLSAISADYASLDFLNVDIWGTRLSVDQLINDIGQFLDVGSALDAYLDQTDTATASLGGYIEYLTNNWLAGLPFATGGVSPLTFALTANGFKLNFADTASFSRSAKLSLGPEGEQLGVQVDSTLDFTVDLDLDFEVSFDLNNDSVAFDLQNFGVSATASSTDIEAEGRIGPLDASIGKSGDEGSASINLTGDISYDGTSFSVLSSGVVDVNLPFFVTLGGGDLTAGSNPRFVASGDFLLDANDPNYIQVTTDGFAELADFSNLDFSQIAVAIRGVSNWLADLSQSSSFDLEIPYVDLKLSEVVRFSDAYITDVVNRLDLDNINSIQDLATEFINKAILPDGLEISYDADQRELILPLRFSEVWNLPAQALMFGDNLSEVDLGLSTQASAIPEVTVSGGLDVVFDLDGGTDGGLAILARDAMVEATANLLVNDLTVAAQLGALGLTLGGPDSESKIVVNTTARAILDEDDDVMTTDDRTFNFSDLIQDGLLDNIYFDVTGEAEAMLKKIEVDGDFGSLLVDPDSAITLSANLLDPNDVEVTLPDLGQILDLRNIRFENVIGAIREGLDVLERSLSETDFYTTAIPGVDSSIKDLFAIVDKFGERLQNAVAERGTLLQGFESVIEDSLGINDDNTLAPLEQKFSFILEEGIFRIHTNWSEVFTEMVGFNLSLADIKKVLPQDTELSIFADIDSLTDLVNIEAASQIEVFAELDAVIDVGIVLESLETTPFDPDIFVYDYNAVSREGTRFVLNTRVKGDRLNLTFSAGQFKFGVVGGDITIDGDGEAYTDDYAVLTVVVDQQGGPDDDGRLLLDEALENNLNWSLTGAMDIALPLDLITETNSVTVGTMRIMSDQLETLVEQLAAGGLNDESSAIKFEFDNILDSILSLGNNVTLANLLNDPANIIDGIGDSLEIVQNLLGEGLGAELPLVGSYLYGISGFIGDVRNGVLADLRTAVDVSPIELVRNGLWSTLGISGLNVLTDRNGDEAITVDDVGIFWVKEDSSTELWQSNTDAPDNVIGLEFDLNLGAVVRGEEIPLDFNLPGIDMSLDGSLVPELTWTYDLHFGLSTAEGFYLVADDESSEFDVEIGFFLEGEDGEPFTGNGILGPLSMSVEDQDRDLGEEGFQFSGVFGELNLNILPSGTNEDGNNHVTVNQMLNAPKDELFDLDVSLDAIINFEVTLGLNTEEGSLSLPELSADLKFDWGWSYADGISSPELSLTNISLDLGSLISGFVTPIANRVADTLQPVGQFLDQFTEPLPGLDQVDGFGEGLDEDGNPQHPANILGLINLFNELEERDPIDWSFVTAAQNAINLVETINNSLNYSGSIALGSISGLATGNVTWEAATNQNIPAGLEQSFGEIAESSRGGNIDSSRSGFVIFDYIKDIGNWAKLLQGESATLFTYELPILDTGFAFDEVIGRFLAGPIPISIAGIGSLKLAADLAFGFDTFGIQKAITNGNPLLAVDGFYIDDTDIATGNEKPELSIQADIGIKAGIDIAVAEAGAQGKITFLGEFDINDPDNDGKLRVSELDELLRYDATDNIPTLLDLGAFNGFYNLFDINARSDALVSLYARADYIVGEIDYNYNLLEYNLFNWGYQAPDPVPNLGHVEGNTLYVHSGSRAIQRAFIDVADGGETFTLSGDGNAVSVSYNEFTQDFDGAGITKVVFDGGAGNDTLDASNLTGVAITFDGGVGNDTVTTGTGSGHQLRGGEGNDTLDATRSSGAQLWGGEGNDELLGGSGDDVLVGESGADKLVGGAGADVLDGGAGSDNLTGNAGVDTYEFADGWGEDRFDDLEGRSFLDFSALSDETLIDSPGQVSFEFSTATSRLNVGRADVSVIDGSNRVVDLIERPARSGDFRTLNLSDILGDKYSNFNLVSSSQQGEVELMQASDFASSGVFYVAPVITGATLSEAGELVEASGTEEFSVTITANQQVNDQVSREVSIPVTVRFTNGYSGLDADVDRIPDELSSQLDRMRLQQRLNYLGYVGRNGSPLVVDGDFGGATSNTQWAIGHFNAVIDGETTVTPTDTLSTEAQKWIHASNAPRWVGLPDSIGSAVHLTNSTEGKPWATDWILESLFAAARTLDSALYGNLTVLPLSDIQGNTTNRASGLQVVISKPTDGSSFIAQVAAFQGVRGIGEIIVTEDITADLQALIGSDLSFTLKVDTTADANSFVIVAASQEAKYNPVLSREEQQALLSLFERVDDLGQELGGLEVLQDDLPVEAAGDEDAANLNEAVGPGVVGSFMRLENAFRAYLSSLEKGEDPNVDDLADALQDYLTGLVGSDAKEGGKLPVTIEVGYSQDTEILQFDVSSEIRKDFLATLGFASPSEDGEEQVLSIPLIYELDFSFGIDLTNVNEGNDIQSSDLFFMLNALDIKFGISVDEWSFDLDLGAVQLAVTEATIEFFVGANVTIADGLVVENRLTLDTLTSIDFDDLFVVSTVGLENGQVEIDAKSASLKLGPLTASIRDYSNENDGNPNTIEDEDDIALSITYGIKDKTFSLNADILDVTIGNVIKAEIPGLTIAYDPNGPDEQELIGLSELELTLIPFNNKKFEFEGVETTVSGQSEMQKRVLSIRKNGFFLAGKQAAFSTAVTVGSFLRMNGLTVGISAIDYTMSDIEDDTLAGMINFSSADVNVNVGGVLTSSFINFNGSYDIANEAFSFDAEDWEITIADIFKITTTGQTSFNYAPNAPLGQELLGFENIQNIAFIPLGLNFAINGVERTIDGKRVIRALSIRNDGFFLAGLPSYEIGDLSLGSLFTLKDLALSLSNITYTVGQVPDVDLRLSADSAEFNISDLVNISFSDSNDPGSKAVVVSYDIADGDYSLALDDWKINVFEVFEFSLEEFNSTDGLTLNYNPLLQGRQKIGTLNNIEVKDAIPSITFRIDKLEIYNDGVIAIQRGGSYDLSDAGDVVDFLLASVEPVEVLGEYGSTIGNLLGGEDGLDSLNGSIFESIGDTIDDLEDQDIDLSLGALFDVAEDALDDAFGSVRQYQENVADLLANAINGLENVEISAEKLLELTQAGSDLLQEVFSFGSDGEIDFTKLNEDIGGLLEDLGERAEDELAELIVEELNIEGDDAKKVFEAYTKEIISFVSDRDIDFSNINDEFEEAGVSPATIFSDQLAVVATGSITRLLGLDEGIAESVAPLVNSFVVDYTDGLVEFVTGKEIERADFNWQDAGATIVVSELVDALGLEGEIAEVATELGSQALSQLVTNISTGADLTAGFSDIDFKEASVDFLASYVGREIGAEVYEVKSKEGQIGASLGASAGAKIGGTIGGVPGAVIGAAIGYIIGGVFGDLFGGTPRSGADVIYDHNAREFKVTNVWRKDGGSASTARQLATSAADTLNALLNAMGGEVLNTGVIYGGTYGLRENRLTYRPEGRNSPRSYFNNPTDLVNFGVIHALDDLVVADGNIYAKRVVYRDVEQYIESGEIPADALTKLLGYLTTAVDYENYLTNTNEVNEFIQLSPQSAFTAGWVATLEQAQAMGLTRRFYTDHNGGWEYLVKNEFATVDTGSGVREVAASYADVELLYDERGRVIEIKRADNSVVVIDDYVEQSTKTQFQYVSQAELANLINIRRNELADDIQTFAEILEETRIEELGGSLSEQEIQDIRAQAFIDASALLVPETYYVDDDRIYVASGQGIVDADGEIISSAIIYGTAGNDVIASGNLGNDVFGGAGNDTIDGDKNADWLYGGDGDDTLNAVAGVNNLLFGEGDNDTLIGGDGSDWLVGGSGNDSIQGGAGDDVLDGNTGIDILEGQAGNDTYIFNRGDGQNILIDQDESFNEATARQLDISGQSIWRNGIYGGEIGGGNDSLEFGEGIRLEHLRIRKDGEDLVVILLDDNGLETTDTLNIQNWENSFRRVEKFRFADGQEIDLGNFNSFIVGSDDGDIISGTDGNDFIHGGGGDDVINALLGNDVAIGGLGNDIVSGDGDDDLVVGGEGSDNLFGSSGNDVVSGDQGDDLVDGGVGDDVLSGGEGNDTIVAGLGDDLIIFGRGDGKDTVFDARGVGATVIWQHINGQHQFAEGYGFYDNPDAGITGIYEIDQVIKVFGVEIPTYRFKEMFFYDATYEGIGALLQYAESGSNVAQDFGQDTLEFKMGVSLQDLRVDTDGNDLLIGISDTGNPFQSFDDIADTVRLVDWFGSAGPAIENFRIFGFGDIDASSFIGWIGGNSDDDQLSGGAGRDWITAGAGQDTLVGNAGDDILNAGADDDLLEGGAGADILLGGRGEDTADYSQSDVGVTVNLIDGIGSGGHAEGDLLDNIEYLVGSDYDDVLIGDEGDNDLIANGGNDLVIGSFGDDRYLFARGHGSLYIAEKDLERGIDADGEDILEFGEGINPGDLDFNRINEFDLEIRLHNTTDQIIIRNWFFDDSDRVEILLFANGGAIDIRFQLFKANATASADWIGGDPGDNTLQGLGGNDILSGRAGNDLLEGGIGNDLMFGGEGADHFDGGAGIDTVAYYDSDQGVRVYLDNSTVATGGVAAGDTFDSVENVIGSGLNDALYGTRFKNTLNGGEGNDLIDGGDGADTLRGADGDDVLLGGSGQDEISGNGGNDEIYGGRGDDILSGGDETDVIYGNEGNDEIDGGDGQNQLYGGADDDFIRGGLDSEQLFGDGGNDELRANDGDDHLHGGAGRDALFGEDGNDLIYADDGSDYAAGGGGDDTLYGGSDDDVLQGGIGQDHLYGDEGDDVLAGGVGDDILEGGQGSDFLIGDGGNDRLLGGQGTDFYVFAGDFGQDTIYEAADREVLDEIIFSRIGLQQLWLTEEGDDLLISVIATENQVRVENFARFRINSETSGEVLDALSEAFAELAPIDSLRVDTHSLSIDAISDLIDVMAEETQPETVDAIPESVVVAQDVLWQPEELTALEARLDFEPVLNSETFELNEDEQFEGQLEATDQNPDELLTYEIVTLPSRGSLSLNSDSGTFNFTPPSEFFGEVVAVVRVVDSTDLQDDATLRFIVNPVDDPGEIEVNITLITTEDSAVTADLNFFDEDNIFQDYDAEATPTLGNISFLSDGRFNYVPFENAEGVDVFTVTLTDRSERTYISQIRAEILGENDRPVALSPQVYDVDSSVITSQVTFFDADVDDEHTFELISTVEGNLDLHSDGSFIYTVADDYDGDDRFIIRVRDDSGDALSFADIEIQILDLEGPPVFSGSNFSFAIAENAGRQLLGFVVATDPDGQLINYRLSENFDSLFEITDQGQLFVTRSLDFETQQSFYELNVIADVSVGVDATQAVTIEVLDVIENSAPDVLVFEPDSNLIFSEGLPVGTIVGTVSATDPENNLDRIELNVNGAPFALGAQIPDGSNPNRLIFEIVTTAVLDFDDPSTIRNYNLTATAFDNGTPPLSRTGSFSVTLQNVNEAPTDISVIQALGIDENANANTIVGQVRATDQDANESFTYVLTNTAGNRFTIDSSGVIRVALGALLNYEDATSHLVSVRATDSGNNTYIEDFIIPIRNLDETPIAIAWTNGTPSIPETTVAGTVVGSFTVTDPDTIAAFRSWRFSMDGNNAQGRFTIDANTGVVRVGDIALDVPREGRSYTVRVRVTDTDDPNSFREQDLTIIVTNVNSAPVVVRNEPGLAINEYSAWRPADDGPTNGAYNGQFVTNVSSLFNDPDGDPLTYRFAFDPISGFFNPFAIDRNSGDITVNNATRANYESKTSHTLLIRASDGQLSSSYAEVTINLQDVDENQKVFTGLGGDGPFAGHTVVYTNFYDTIALPYGFRLGYSFEVYSPDSQLVASARIFVGLIDDGNSPPFQTPYLAPGYVFDVEPVDTNGNGNILDFFRGVSKDWNYFHPPLALDLNNDGLAWSTSVLFDVDNDSEMELTPWVDAADALLVLDRNNNGFIDNGSEISFTADLPDASTDLEGLVAFDTNGDEVLDAKDARFGEFQVWRDANQNGVSEAEELQTLSEVGIVSLSLQPIPNSDPTGVIGIALLNTSFFTRSDGSTSLLGDVRFTFSEVDLNSAELAPLTLGTDGSNTIIGLLNADNIDGLGGADQLFGGEGNDRIQGGDDDDLVAGEEGADELFGGNGDDLIIGGDGDDQLNGDSGSDSLQGGIGNDLAYGGDGDDRIEGNAGNDHLYGEAGVDALVGDDGDDWLDGGADNDQLNGGAGDDTVIGGAGSDEINGGAGNDVIAGGLDDDLINGGAGENALWYSLGDGIDHMVNGGGTYILHLIDIDSADIQFIEDGATLIVSINAGTGAPISRLIFEDYQRDGLFDAISSGALSLDGIVFYSTEGEQTDQWDRAELLNQLYAQLHPTVEGSLNNDILQGSDDNELIEGYSGNDQINALGGDDQVYGHSGDDQIRGGSGNDLLNGGSGSDELQGDAGDDALYGQAGVDQLAGGADNDRLYGGADDDQLSGGDGDDQLYGQTGEDILLGGAGDDFLDGGAGNDQLQGNEGEDLLVGGQGDDTLAGGAADDSLEGGAGKDNISGDDGSDILNGGSGDDQLNGGAGMDILVGETGDDLLEGAAGADSLFGDAGQDELLGGLGNDVLSGGADDDILEGGLGNDVLSGGAGYNLIRFVRGDGQDTVVAGTLATDRYELELYNITSDELSVLNEIINTDQGDIMTLVLDFGQGDRIVFEGYDPNDPSTSPLDAIRFITFNNAPIAVDDNYETLPETTLVVDSTQGVLSNDSYTDGDSLQAVLVDDVSHGSLAFNPDGSFTYTPDSGFLGFDSFTYKADDGQQSSAVVTVSLSVLDALLEYSLEEGSGTTAIDASGRGNDGNLVNGPLYTPESADGSDYSLSFDGVDDYIDAGLLDVNGSGLTLAAWFKADRFTGANSDGRIISKASGISDDEHIFMLSTIKSGSEVYLRGRVRVEGTTTVLIASSGALSTDTWYHAALTYDGAMLRLYLDGVEVGSTALSGVMDTDSTLPVAIGAQLPGAGKKFFSGLIDDVRLYNHALGADGIGILATRLEIPTIPALISHWKFDEGTGNMASDSSATGNDGTLSNLNNDAWISDTAPVNSGNTDAHALSFSGSNDFVEVPHSDAYLLDNGTVAFWFKDTGSIDTAGLWSKDSKYFDDGGHLNIRTLSDGTVQARLQSDSQDFFVKTTDSITLGEWHHVAFTFGDEGMKIYLDGVLQDTEYYTGGLVGNSEPIAIGANTWNSDDGTVDSTTEHFSGIIDDVRVYNAALYQAEIQELAGAIPAVPVLVGHWKLDEGTGNTASDSSETGNDGTLSHLDNEPWVAGHGTAPTDFANPSAISVEGSNGFVEVPHSDAYLLDNGTVAFWFKDTGNIRKAGLWSKDSGGFDSGGHLTISTESDGTVQARLQSNTASFTVSTTEAITLGEWNHVAFSFGEEGMKLYLNGVLQDSDAYSGGLGASSGGIGNFEPIAIGASTWQSGDRTVNNANDHFSGLIDDVRLYNHALDVNGIVTLAARLEILPIPDLVSH